MAAMPCSAAARSAACANASETATTCAPDTAARRTRRWVVPIRPAPMTPMFMDVPPSRRRWEVHLGGVGRLVGPARRDDLPARVEPHALGAVDVVVAEQRVLPAAEAV